MNIIRRVLGIPAKVVSDQEFAAGYRQRALAWARDIKEPFWEGDRIEIIPLPTMPSDGTGQCGKNCCCKWRIVVIDRQRGDYDAYWELAGSDEPCQSCEVRSEEWNPIRIRDFLLED